MTYYDSVRESTVFVQSEIEGFLDKKESGALSSDSPGYIKELLSIYIPQRELRSLRQVVAAVDTYNIYTYAVSVFGSKTTRRWCWVQGSIFYQQKPSTNSNNPGGINILEMSDAHSVKNVPSDTTGTQFEIFVKKKSQVYICSSREECTAWIKALQKAMAIKGSRQTEDSCQPTFHTPFNEEDQQVYSVISETASGNQIPSSKLQNGHGNAPQANNVDPENIYFTPDDSVENVYSDVSDVDKTQRETVKNVPLSAKKSTPPPLHPDTNNNGNDSIYYEGCSTGPQENNPCSPDKDSAGTKEGECSYAEGFSTGQLKQGRYVKNDSVKGHGALSPKPYRIAPVAPHMIRSKTVPSTSTTAQADPPTPVPSTVKDSDEVEETNHSEDQLLEIFNSMDIDSTVDDLEFVITNDDAIPVTDLKTVLRQNDVHCRISMNRLSKSKDPIGACRSFLSTLKN